MHLRCSATLTGDRGRCTRVASKARRRYPVCHYHEKTNRFVPSPNAQQLDPENYGEAAPIIGNEKRQFA